MNSIETSHIISLATSEIKLNPRLTVKYRNQFDQWNNSRNKKSLLYLFKDSLFGAIYVTQLFQIRKDTFSAALMEVNQDAIAENYFKTKNKIVSIGCGPGPEIVAYLNLVLPLRQESGNNSQLEIMAIDKLNYWSKYIDTIEGNSFGKTKITFMNEDVDKSFISKLSQHDICIISFIDAGSGDNIWEDLTKKFSIVIILEVNDAFRPACNKYNHKRFRGNKGLFYFIAPNELSNTDSSDSNLTTFPSNILFNSTVFSNPIEEIPLIRQVPTENDLVFLSSSYKTDFEKSSGIEIVQNKLDSNEISTYINLEPESLKLNSNDIEIISKNEEIKVESDAKSINPVLESGCLQSNPINIDLINGNPKINEENIKNNELVEGNLCNENCTTAMDNSTNTDSVGYLENNNINTNARKRKITDDDNDDEVSDKRTCI